MQSNCFHSIDYFHKAAGVCRNHHKSQGAGQGLLGESGIPLATWVAERMYVQEVGRWFDVTKADGGSFCLNTTKVNDSKVFQPQCSVTGAGRDLPRIGATVSIGINYHEVSPWLFCI